MATAARPQGPLRVMLVDDHRSVLWGLERLVNGESPSMAVCATATSCDEALARATETRPDVILLDLDLGTRSAIEIIPELLAASGGRVLVLTGTREAAMHDRAILAGASGVVRKADPAEVILKAIAKASEGELWLDRASTGRLFVEMTQRGAGEATNPHHRRMATLTARERQIVEAMVTDASASTRMVAERLCISEHTLRNHLTSIYDKLGVANRLELWAYANQHGLDRRGS